MNRAFAIIDVLPDEFRIKNIDRIRSIIDWPEITEISFVNGWAVGKEWMELNGVASTSLLLGEMGCVASAVEAWKYIASSDYDEVLLFENDAIIVDGFVTLFDAYRSQVPDDLDAFSLCSAASERWRFDHNRAAFDIGSDDVCRAFQNWPSNAVLYTRDGAQKALESFKEVKSIEYHIDVWLYEHSGLNVYTLTPAAPKLVGRYKGKSMANPSWTGVRGKQVEW